MVESTESIEWVALSTCLEDADRPDSMFWEEGGIYPNTKKPRHASMEVARRLEPGETIVACRRCGQRFAATEDSTADDNLAVHFFGDIGTPSICAPRKGGAKAGGTSQPKDKFAERVRAALESFTNRAVQAVRDDEGFSARVQGQWLRLITDAMPDQQLPALDQLNDDQLGDLLAIAVFEVRTETTGGSRAES